MNINEKALLYRAQAGDRQAAGTLFECYYQEIYTYIFYRVSDRFTAETLTAVVFIRMLGRLPTYFNQGKSILSWLYTIAKQLVIDYYRTQDKNDKLTVKDRLLGGNQHEPEGPVQSPDSLDSFQRALRQLKEQQKHVIILRLVEGRSVQDIAELINKSEQAVRSLQGRALRSLERLLKRKSVYEQA
jgi:RNA polymerase sigma-70 factor (ECF subfamily)